MARYIIFHNPISGEGRAGRLVTTVAAELRQRGHHVDDYCSTSRDDAIQAAQRLDPSYDAVIGIGGDGTQNSLVNGLLGRPVPLLPVPAGTENVLCRAVGIPPDPAVIRRTLESHSIRTLDVGVVNGHAFTVMSGVGFDAAVTREVHRNRRGPIKRCYYYWPTFRNWCAYGWPPLAVEVDGTPLIDDAAFVVVGNMRLYADRMHVCAHAAPDDGLLDVCVYTRPGRWRLLGYFLATRFNRHLKRRDVIYRQASRIVVRSTATDVPFQVDGDAAGEVPAEYAVRPAAVRMFVRSCC